jgi:hypothetical protein
MTTAATPSTIFARIISYGAVLALAIAVLGSLAGFMADGGRGVVSALIGAAIAFVFTGVTGASIILANRVAKGDLLNPGYFGIVLGGWLLKFVVFLVLLILLKDQPWVNTMVLFLSIVVSILGSLVIDVVVIARSRLPYVDVTLPGDDKA